MQEIFQRVVAGIEQHVTDKPAYDRIVKAGMKVMYDKKTHQMIMDGMAEAQDLATWAGKGIVGVLVMLAKQSRGTMPFMPMLEAGVTLLMDGLDFLASIGKVEPTQETISRAVKAYGMAMLGASGISEEQVRSIGEQANKAMEDPKMAEQMQSRLKGA